MLCSSSAPRDFSILSRLGTRWRSPDLPHEREQRQAAEEHRGEDEPGGLVAAQAVDERAEGRRDEHGADENDRDAQAERGAARWGPACSAWKVSARAFQPISVAPSASASKTSSGPGVSAGSAARSTTSSAPSGGMQASAGLRRPCQRASLASPHPIRPQTPPTWASAR